MKIILLTFAAFFCGLIVGALTLTERPAPAPTATVTPLPSVAATPVPTMTPVPFEYRCFRTTVTSEFLPGVQTQIGETLICGYELMRSGILGPSLEAHLGDDGIKVYVTGTKEATP